MRAAGSLPLRSASQAALLGGGLRALSLGRASLPPLPPALTLALHFLSPPRVRRVLQPLPQRGAGHPVRHLQGLHLPVRHLPRGRARLLQLLPHLRPRRPHQPHDGVVPHAGGVPHGLRLPLPAREHLLSQGGEQGTPRTGFDVEFPSSAPRWLGMPQGRRGTSRPCTAGTFPSASTLPALPGLLSDRCDQTPGLRRWRWMPGHRNQQEGAWQGRVCWAEEELKGSFGKHSTGRAELAPARWCLSRGSRVIKRVFFTHFVQN